MMALGMRRGMGKHVCFNIFPHFPVVGQFFCYCKFVVNTEKICFFVFAHYISLLGFHGQAGLAADPLVHVKDGGVTRGHGYMLLFSGPYQWFVVCRSSEGLQENKQSL